MPDGSQRVQQSGARLTACLITMFAGGGGGLPRHLPVLHCASRQEEGPQREEKQEQEGRERQEGRIVSRERTTTLLAILIRILSPSPQSQ